MDTTPQTRQEGKLDRWPLRHALALALLLAAGACATPPPAGDFATPAAHGLAESSVLPTTTPASLMVAEYDAAQALAAAQATAGEVQRRIMENTAQAQATADAYRFRTTATADALVAAQAQRAAAATQSSLGWAAQAESQQATATAQAQLLAQANAASAATATQQTRELEVAQAAGAVQRREAWREFWSVFAPAAVVLAAVLLGALLGWAAIRYVTMRLDSMERRQAVMETRAGTVVWVLNGRQPVPQLLKGVGDARLTLADDGSTTEAQIIDAEPIRYSVMGRPAGYLERGDPQGERVARALARRLVWDAMRVNGAASNVIPGWRKLDGWNSDRWQQAREVLQAAGAVETVERKGTFVSGQWMTLSDLLNAIDIRVLPLAPPPPRNGGAAGDCVPAHTGTAQHSAAQVQAQEGGRL